MTKQEEEQQQEEHHNIKKKDSSALVALGHDYEGLEGCTMSRFGGSLLNPDLDRVM